MNEENFEKVECVGVLGNLLGDINISESSIGEDEECVELYLYTSTKVSIGMSDDLKDRVIKGQELGHSDESIIKDLLRFNVDLIVDDYDFTYFIISNTLDETVPSKYTPEEFIEKKKNLCKANDKNAAALNRELGADTHHEDRYYQNEADGYNEMFYGGMSDDELDAFHSNID